MILNTHHFIIYYVHLHIDTNSIDIYTQHIPSYKVQYFQPEQNLE